MKTTYSLTGAKDDINQVLIAVDIEESDTRWTDESSCVIITDNDNFEDLDYWCNEHDVVLKEV